MESATRTLNGHDMELQIHYGMGEVLEEFIFWCHTCNPLGDERGDTSYKSFDPVDYESSTGEEILRIVSKYGARHAESVDV